MQRSRIEPTECRKGSKIIWTWRAGPVVPPEPEDLAPPPEDLIPTISVGLNRIAWGPSATWEEPATSYWSKLAETTFEGVDETITSDRDESGLPAFERVLARVQANVRYVAVELGKGGKIPHAADDRLRDLLALCKAWQESRNSAAIVE